jgi:hypothetical protein
MQLLLEEVLIKLTCSSGHGSDSIGLWPARPRPESFALKKSSNSQKRELLRSLSDGPEEESSNLERLHDA